MATRRMYSKNVVAIREFTLMSEGARLLYYDMGMFADDDGFIDMYNNLSRAKAEDIQELLTSGFIEAVPCPDIYHITHWTVNNQIRKDRYTESPYRRFLNAEGTELVKDMVAKSAPKTVAKIATNLGYKKCQPESDSIEEQAHTHSTDSGKERIDSVYTTVGRGMFKNVFISDSEYAERLEKYPFLDAIIDIMSEWIHENNEKVSSYQNLLDTFIERNRRKYENRAYSASGTACTGTRKFDDDELMAFSEMKDEIMASR